MRNLRGTNITIFPLFFGLTLLEAVQTRDWLRAVFWLAIGLVFLRATGCVGSGSGKWSWYACRVRHPD